MAHRPGLYDAGCEFCRIAAGAGPARIVFEDEGSIGFLPLRPAVTGHTLVIPRSHVRDIWALSPDDARPLLDATLLLARAIRDAFDPDGLNIINSSGAAATQTVFHLHVHLVPRWDDDGFGDIWPRSETPAPEVADATANAIRAAVSR